MQQLANCFFITVHGSKSTAANSRETLYQAGLVEKKLDPKVATALNI
jgi:predicted transcriptional regulator